MKLQDGSEVTTFDAKIKQGAAGDSLEFDVSVSGKFVNLKDGWKLIKQTSSTTPAPGNGHAQYPEMSKEEWAEKQRVERESIESQVAVKAILQYVASIPSDIVLSDEVVNVYDKALKWCESRIDRALATAVQKPAAAATAKDSVQSKAPMESNVEPTKEPLNNVGELLTRCKNYGITRNKAFVDVGVKDASEIIDFDEAWQTIYSKNFPEGAP